jgi:hypothetical protein
MHMMLMEMPRMIEHFMRRAGEPEPDAHGENQ